MGIPRLADELRRTGGIRYRVVGEAPPSAEPVEPTLEDGYVELLRATRNCADGGSAA
jgi:hypothetical protein